jgi:hypothetical protein
MRTLLLGALFIFVFAGLVKRESFVETEPPSGSDAPSMEATAFAARIAAGEHRSFESGNGKEREPARSAIASGRASSADPAAAREAKTIQGAAARDPASPPASVTPVWRDDAKAIAAAIEAPEFLDNATPVARLYFAYFGRSPDVEGFDYYVAQREGGRLLDAISDEFAGSREIELRYGALDNAAYVERVFRNVFGESGDAQQRENWVAQLDSGAMTRGQMMVAFSESPAFRSASANEVFVSIAYTEIFGRRADAEELSRWVAFLDAGNSSQAVIQGLLASR